MKIVILEPIALSQEKLQLFTDPFKNQGHTIEYYDNRPLDNQTIIDRAQDADIVVFTNLSFPKEVIILCTNLKMISVAFTGVDHIDLTACKEQSIVVCNAAGYSTFSVAELTFGLVFYVIIILV